MPYIKQEDREGFAKALKAMPEFKSAGELNYIITKLAMQYITTHGRSYATMNNVVGAFECAKAEFYRRVVKPYESDKIAVNGDVY